MLNIVTNVALERSIVTEMGNSVTIWAVVVLIVTQTLLSVTNAVLGMGIVM